MKDNDNENLTELRERELFPVYCPMCGTWITSLIPDYLPGYMRIKCPNGHRTIFPKGFQLNGTTEVIAG